MPEVEEGLARTYAARYRHELAAITADLPKPVGDGTGWVAVLRAVRSQLAADLATLIARVRDPATRVRTIAIAIAVTVVLLVIGMVFLAFHGMFEDGDFHEGRD